MPRELWMSIPEAKQNWVHEILGNARTPSFQVTQQPHHHICGRSKTKLYLTNPNFRISWNHVQSARNSGRWRNFKRVIVLVWLSRKLHHVHAHLSHLFAKTYELDTNVHGIRMKMNFKLQVHQLAMRNGQSWFVPENVNSYK